MWAIFKDLYLDESGVTAIEYGLIAGLMSAILVVVLGTFSDQLKNLFDAISGKLEKATENMNEED